MRRRACRGNEVTVHIHPDAEKIAELCRLHHIRTLAVFGSATRDDFSPSSDVDVLVEFEPGQVPGFGFITIQDDLEALFGRTVDLNTPGFLSPVIRERVQREATVLYDRSA